MNWISKILLLTTAFISIALPSQSQNEQVYNEDSLQLALTQSYGLVGNQLIRFEESLNQIDFTAVQSPIVHLKYQIQKPG